MADPTGPVDLLAALRASIERAGPQPALGPPSQVEVETAKVRALAALTQATEAMNAANRGLFAATKQRAERRKEALAAGASVEEVRQAIKVGHRLSSGD